MAVLVSFGAPTTWGAPPAASVPMVSPVLDLLQRRGIEIDPEALNHALVEAVVRAADPGGRVMTSEAYAQLRERRSGLRRSAGLRMEWVHDALTVMDIVEGSPAEEAGLSPGAVLDSVDGRFVTGRSVPEIHRWLDEGEPDTVRIDVLLPGDAEVRSLDVKRTVLPRPSIAVAESWPRDLAYLQLYGLHDDAAPSVAARLRRWQEENRFGVMLDLRGAGGERIDAAAALAGLLAERPDDATLVIETRDGSAMEEFMAVAGDRIRMPTMILIDENTEGAAELLAAIVQAVGQGAMLMGTRTSGDCGLREALPWEGNYKLYLRTRRVLLNGRDICPPTHVSGVGPHVEVAPGSAGDPRPPAPSTAGPSRRKHRREPDQESRILHDRIRNDPVLQRAVDVLLGLRALTNPNGFEDPPAEEME